MNDVLRSDALWACILISAMLLTLAAFIGDGIASRRKIRQVWKDWYKGRGRK